MIIYIYGGKKMELAQSAGNMLPALSAGQHHTDMFGFFLHVINLEILFVVIGQRNCTFFL